MGGSSRRLEELAENDNVEAMVANIFQAFFAKVEREQEELKSLRTW